MCKTLLYPFGLITAVVILVASATGRQAQKGAEEKISIGNDDIGGVGTSTKGPEAGVWVIAETTDLPTKLAKIVATDDSGRYPGPQLPKANYPVLGRGDRLLESSPGQGAPRKLR